VAHLLRRAGFGGMPAEIDALTVLPSWVAVVDRVLDTSANPPDTIPAAVDDRDDPYYPPWVAAVHYWMDRMATTPTPIVEKVALFWHGHLTSSIEDPLTRLVFRQVKTWRAKGLGDVHDLLQAMAVDPAMLHYLDNGFNVADEPNENFARELMELFTMGNGTFTESDVIAMARAWTGHNLTEDQEGYAFRPADHDEGAKTLFGITRNWDGPATITEILRGSRQATSARHLAGKIWSFFAYPNPSAALLDELAAAFVAGGLSMKAFLRVVFLRPEFRLATTRTALVRSPIEWLVAILRHTGLPAATLHPEWWMERLGQQLYAPPNVAGWKQNGAWISSSAQWAKGAYADWVRWKAADLGLLAGTDSMTPAAATQAAFDRFGIDDPSPLTRQQLERFVAGEQTARRSWAVPPNLIALAVLTPDFQLA
jgi:uncharacterized protein (DUF1800 family)